MHLICESARISPRKVIYDFIVRSRPNMFCHGLVDMLRTTLGLLAVSGIMLRNRTPKLCCVGWWVMVPVVFPVSVQQTFQSNTIYNT